MPETISSCEFDDLDGWQVVSYDTWERLGETVKEREEMSKSLHNAYEAIREAMQTLPNSHTAWTVLNSVLPEGLDNLEEKASKR